MRGAVLRQDIGDIRLRPFRAGKPPERIDGILCPQFPLVDPLDWAWQLGRVVPEKLLGQVETQLVAEAQQHPELIEASHRDALSIGAAEIEDKAPIFAQLPVD